MQGVDYEDVTEASGLGRFQHIAGEPLKPYLPETTGSGLALLDFDNDGWVDIYFVNSLTHAARRGKEKPLRPPCFATTATARSAMSLPVPASRTTAGARASAPAISTMTVGRIFMSSTWERAVCTATTATGASPMSPLKRGCKWICGRPDAPSEIMTAMGAWTCTWPATSNSIGTIRLRPVSRVKTRESANRPALRSSSGSPARPGSNDRGGMSGAAYDPGQRFARFSVCGWPADRWA